MSHCNPTFTFVPAVFAPRVQTIEKKTKDEHRVIPSLIVAIRPIHHVFYCSCLVHSHCFICPSPRCHQNLHNTWQGHAAEWYFGEYGATPSNESKWVSLIFFTNVTSQPICWCYGQYTTDATIERLKRVLSALMIVRYAEGIDVKAYTKTMTFSTISANPNFCTWLHFPSFDPLVISCFTWFYSNSTNFHYLTRFLIHWPQHSC